MLDLSGFLFSIEFLRQLAGFVLTIVTAVVDGFFAGLFAGV